MERLTVTLTLCNSLEPIQQAREDVNNMSVDVEAIALHITRKISSPTYYCTSSQATALTS